jgi:hyaluronoglucosaminidase
VDIDKYLNVLFSKKKLFFRLTGIIVIDFEVWRPILRQNFGSLVACKTVSYNIERTINPMYNRSQCEVEATKRFESAGREFMQKTLEVAKQLRPHARWGYYAFPYCFNDYDEEVCSKATQSENDRLHWLFADTDVVLPSVYISENKVRKHDSAKMIRGRVHEARRVAIQQKHSPPVLTYVRYVYTDTRKFLTKV